MFSRTAAFYDAIYSFKDYEKESEALHELIQSRLPARTLLDVACGTGKHLEHLRRWYEVEGVDAQPEMVELARERLPGVPMHEGDMRTFNLGRQFDVVTCLFSSIGYMKTTAEYAGAVTIMARHLRPDGIVIIEPWLSPEDFRDNSPHMMLAEEADLKIARGCVSRRDGHLSILEMHYLIATSAGMIYEIERHEMLLLTPTEQVALIAEAGVQASFLEAGLTGRGLLVGTKKPNPL